MNSFVTFACLLAVAGLSHGYGIGAPLITPVLSPAAVSTANLWKAGPIPIVRTISSPIISAPIVKTIVPVAPVLRTVVSPIGLGLNPLGINGLGLNGLNGLGLNPLGINGLGINGLGINGLGVNGLGIKTLGLNGLSSTIIH